MRKMDLFDLYRKLGGNVNPQQGGAIKPYGNFTNWLNEISTELYRDKFRDFEKAQNITDELAQPFLKSVNVTVSDVMGSSYATFAYPTDYGYFSSARIMSTTEGGVGCMCSGLDNLDAKTGMCSKYVDPDELAQLEKDNAKDLIEKSIKKIDNQRWGSAMKDKFLKVSIKNPIITQVNGLFKVAPKGVGIIVLDYLKLPVKASFAYTTGGNDEIIYDQANSVQLDWPDTVEIEFLTRLEKKYGKYIREEFIYTASESERQIAK